MNESLRLVGKRALTIAVAAATIAWSVGLSAFVAPMTASAATPGGLVKGTTLSTVYYYSTDGSRYAFPNEKTYLTWYSDFSSVETISDSELAAIPLAGNVVYRPGSRFIKIQSDDKTYAVTPQGHIRWIESEAVASGLAGDNWNQFIDDVPDVFFVDYTVGASLVSAASGYNGMLLEGSTYLIWNGEKRMVTDSGFSANRFQDRFVVSGAGVDLDGLSAGPDVTGSEGVLSSPTQQDEAPAPTGTLNVSLASDTPVSATIPGNADSVSFTKLKWEGTASVDQIKVRLGGVGATNNIENAYLYSGSTRLTDGRSINSTTREATFSALNIDVAGSAYTTVRADIADANGGDTANFGIASASKVSSSAAVTGNFPVTGNTMTFSDENAGEVVFDKTGSIDDPTIGEQDAIVGRFKIDANGEDAWLHELLLNIDDADDHSDFKLWQSNDLVASCENVGSDHVSCVLPNPHFIEDGDEEQFKVSLDVGGESGDDIKVAIEEPADVMATGGDFGFNLSVDINDDGDGDGYDETNCTASTGDCSFSTILGGDLTFVFNGPPSDDIQIDGDDQNIMDFAITAENFTELKEMGVIMDCLSGTGCGNATADDAGGFYHSDDSPNFNDFTIRHANGSTWMGPEELAATESAANDDQQTLTFDDNQNLQGADTVDLMITVDVENNAVAGNVIRATLDMSTVDAEDANGDSLSNSTDITPTSDIVGNQFTLEAASLEVTLSQPPASGTYVKGVQNIDVVGHNFEAGDTSDIVVTDTTITIDASDTSDDNTDNNELTEAQINSAINSCSLYDSETGSLIDGPEGITQGTDDASNDVTSIFDSFSWTVPAGETDKMLTRCNFANVDVQSSNADEYEFGIAAAGDITAEDEDGDSVTATGTFATNTDDTIIDIVDSGTLNVTLDGSTPNSDIILGSSTGVLVSVFEVDATDENFVIQELTVVNCVNYDTSDPDDCTGGTNEADGADDIASNVVLTYENEAGETKTKTSSLSNTRAKFKSLDLWAPSSDDMTFSVSIDTNSVSSTGATTGDSVQLNLVDGNEATNFTTSAVGTIQPTFKAVGQASGETVRDIDGDGAPTTIAGVAANDHVVRKTKPTLTLNSQSPSGASTPSFQEVFKFNVAADSRGSVELEAVTFRVSFGSAVTAVTTCDGATTLNDATKWEFYDASDSSEKLDDDNDWFFLDDDAADDACTNGDVIKYVVLDMAADTTTPTEDIGAGLTNVYVVKADTTGLSTANDDSFRLDIIDETEADASGEDCVDASGPDCISYDDDDAIAGAVDNTGVDAGAGDADELDAIAWDDGELADPSGTAAISIDGTLVDNLPITGGTLVY